jgi:nucleoside-diphosphate-sugar epimerase
VFNCANPAYHRWSTDWPPIADSLLVAAESSGATLVTLSNLYGYGVPSGPMTPHDPLNANYEKAQVRVKMFRDAMALHEAGRITAVEVRASDFIGPDSNSVLGDRAVPRILRGKSVQVLGDPDAPHSWSDVGDVATTLVTVATEEHAWGRAWHCPTNAPRSQREAVNDLADAAGVAHVKIQRIAPAMLRVAGLFSPLMRELPKTLYQFPAPFVIDDSETRQLLGLEPTPWDQVLAAQIAPFLESARG